MSFIKRIFLFFKNIFNKQEEVKRIQEPNDNIKQDKKEHFIESLKTNNTEKKTKKKVETLTCNGDGLGIQKKISY